MSTSLEGIVRPFQDHNVQPSAFTRPGQGSTPRVRVKVGYVGSVKVLAWNMSATVTFKMGQAHHEKAPLSKALQQALAEVGT